MQIGTFSEESLNSCRELMSSDTLDFNRCERPDGTFYGTGGQCRKGTPANSFQGPQGIGTNNTGGVLGGNLFPKAARELDTEEVLDKFEKSFDKYWDAVRSPFGKKKKRALEFIASAKDFVDLVRQEKEAGNYDEAARLTRAVPMGAGDNGILILRDAGIKDKAMWKILDSVFRPMSQMYEGDPITFR
jgi:hypothetical protein